MDLNQERKIIENDLLRFLNLISPHHSSNTIYEYAVMPPGKAFRPLLVKAIAKDMNKEHSQLLTENLALYASAIEIHHSYTLVHDDLPCMDNDDIRRGKPSTHKQYGQWQALLGGDGLLIASFSLLSKMKTTKLREILALFSHFTGPKGLIHGQYLDLSHEMNLSFSKLIETHTLKTARLIQAAILGGHILAQEEKTTLKDAKNLARLGEAIGVNFQLLDDLTELVDETLSEHENDVNPWIKEQSKNECLEKLVKGLQLTDKLINEYKLENIGLVLEMYYSKMRNMLEENHGTISKHVQLDLLPIMSLLQFRGQHYKGI
ncbi:polyprenyl synthetase family protein [Bacteriovorax sp. BSW11_IV]|uniref:polyprenyl synthetase family protein n=1 Tax=Bacteriovorax sp. BSW11_IV TaxID=1353529 RepID=UPI000555A1B8|nr:polyprenyl synthetase family protein [Bacteriovorax sp. BSW11_IV]